MIGSNIRCDTNQIPSLNEMVKTISAFTCFLSTTKQVVTTHVSTTPTSITNPRTGSHGEHPQQPVFSLEKSSRRSTNTQWLLWRWANYFQRAWSWSWNAAYACGYLVPWCSPLGVRALFSSQPFYADLELSQVRLVVAISVSVNGQHSGSLTMPQSFAVAPSCFTWTDNSAKDGVK